MRKLILIIVLGILVMSCSSDDQKVLPETIDEEYFNLNFGGILLSVDPNNNSASFNRASIIRNGDYFTLDVICGFSSSSNEQNFLRFFFDKNGKLIYAERKANSASIVGLLYYNNYHNFPSHYFNISFLSLDEFNKRVKLNFSGNLYLNKNNLNSESVFLNGELDMTYIVPDQEEDYINNIKVNGIDQYCSAKFNNLPWKAWFEDSYSEFTSSDEYKLEPHFSSNTNVGSYNFNPTSTDNYVRFSKFNTITHNYDYYNVSGQVSYSYREFHGLGKYSFIGSCNFTATNPNNPSDVIQVTDGVFRSYQQF